MKIYTKTGDAGETSLLLGDRVSKDCITLQVVGGLDELNSVLGVVVATISVSNFSSLILSTDVINFLIQIQKDLFKLGSELASLQNDTHPDSLVNVKQQELISMLDIENLEKQIDVMEQSLPELKNFILPGGSLVGAHLHQTRTICRRVERELVSFGREKKVRTEVYQYLNRLSDYLFVLARYINFKLEVPENIIKF